MLTDLSGKVILITGGAQGIGAAAARLCARRGAVIYIADLNIEQGETLARELNAIQPGAAFFPLDVSSEEQVQQVIAQIQALTPKLDGLVCAAGILRGAFLTPEELTAEDFQMVQQVNVTGVFLSVKYAMPLLQASKQSVVVIIASGAGVQGPSSSLAYAASKGGANGLSMTLAAQLESRGIRVNTLSPGSIITEMKLRVELENARRQGIPEEEAIQNARRNYGMPEGVAPIIAFMLSDEADYLRGTLYTR